MSKNERSKIGTTARGLRIDKVRARKLVEERLTEIAATNELQGDESDGPQVKVYGREGNIIDVETIY